MRWPRDTDMKKPRARLWVNSIEDHNAYFAHFPKIRGKIGKTSNRANLDKLLEFILLLKIKLKINILVLIYAFG